MNRLVGIIIAISIGLLALVQQAMAATDRVALVIGNGNYQAANALPNPVNDAKLIAKTLKDIGFDVTAGYDLGKADMVTYLDRFTERAYNADVALIYYAGHGMQVDGENYLVPVDAVLSEPAHLKTRTINMRQILAALPLDPAVGILIMDACRDNPLARSLAASMKTATRSAAVNSGLAMVQTASEGDGTGGLLIGYSTDPGAVALDGEGGNSPYTAALARHLATPGLNIHSVLTRVRNDVSAATGGQQRPWYNASLGRDIYLAGSSEAVAVNDGVSEAEQAYWEQAVKLGDAGSFKLYLKDYPNGHFRSIAEASIEQLEGDKSLKVAALLPRNAELSKSDNSEPVLGGTDLQLDKQQRLELQIRLKSLGFDPKGIDGNLGPGSRTAIAAWQAKNDFEASGILDGAQYAILLQQSDAEFATAYQAYEEDLKATDSGSKGENVIDAASSAVKNSVKKGVCGLLKC